MLNGTKEKRFWERVNIKDPDECWKYARGISSNGYGHFQYHNVQYPAHRVAWELTNGPISDKKEILHKCDNRACCNPSHLYCGTQCDNMCDRVERTRFDRICNQPKLHEGEIWLIRRLKIPIGRGCINQRYKFSARYVAKMFKVDHGTILRIWEFPTYMSKEGYV